MSVSATLFYGSFKSKTELSDEIEEDLEDYNDENGNTIEFIDDDYQYGIAHEAMVTGADFGSPLLLDSLPEIDQDALHELTQAAVHFKFSTEFHWYLVLVED